MNTAGTLYPNGLPLLRVYPYKTTSDVVWSEGTLCDAGRVVLAHNFATSNVRDRLEAVFERSRASIQGANLLDCGYVGAWLQCPNEDLAEVKGLLEAVQVDTFALLLHATAQQLQDLARGSLPPAQFVASMRAERRRAARNDATA
jgi:hypothetical protein